MTRLYLILPLLFLFACQPGVDQKLLQGEWKAAQLLEDGTPKEIDLSPIQFQFKPNGRYFYQGTVQYSESGTYYTSGDVLMTTDTTVETRKEKSVRILKLISDSLHFEMNAGGKPQLLYLYRVDR